MLDAQQEYENTGEKSLLKDIARYNNIQMAKKISLNSAYGAIGNNWFRYFDLLGCYCNYYYLVNCLFVGLRKVSTFILTKSWKRKTWTTLLLRIQTAYTLRLTNWLVRCLKREQKLTLLSTSWTRLQKRSWNLLLIKVIKNSAKVTNAYEQKMEMGREAIADKGIWTAKKRYILNLS